MTTLESLASAPPPELREYFSALEPSEATHLLELTTRFRKGHPLAQAFELVVLDDQQTSNYYAYILRGPLTGTVLHLCHDDDSKVVYESLQQFLDSDRDLREPPAQITSPDSTALADYCRQLLDQTENKDRVVPVLVALVPCLTVSDLELWDRLGRHPNFYVAEAVGWAIENYPRPELQAAAEALSQHRHPQAASAGKRALSALKC